MTTASKITMLRIALIPVFFVLMLVPFPGHMWVSLAVFIVASLTDTLDGHIARTYNQVSDFGKFIDPLADKLLVFAAVLIFVAWGQIPSWAAMVIIAREFAVTGLRLIAVENGVVIAAAWSGKIKTTVSLIGLCLMMTPWHDTPIIGRFDIDWLVVVLMLITTVWSGVEYFVKNGKLLNLRR